MPLQQVAVNMILWNAVVNILSEKWSLCLLLCLLLLTEFSRMGLLLDLSVDRQESESTIKANRKSFSHSWHADAAAAAVDDMPIALC